MKAPLAALLLGLLLACGGTEKPTPTPADVELTVDQTELALTSLSAPVQLTADAHGAEGTIQWSLAGPGSLTSLSGASVTYSPPAGVADPVTATLTASLGSEHVDVSIHLLLSRFFVNPASGADDAVGSHAHPFKTVSRGLKAANTGMAIILQDGTYPWSDEDPYALIPEGVTLQGETPDGALLDGTGTSSRGLTLEGDGQLSSLRLKGFKGAALTATTGTLLLQHLIVEGGAGLQLSGDAKATLEDFDFTISGASRGFWIAGGAALAASNGAIRSDKTNFAPVLVLQAGTLTAENVEIDSTDLGLQLENQAAATFKGSRLTRSVVSGVQPLVLIKDEARLSLESTMVSDEGALTLSSHGQLTLTGTQVGSTGMALVVGGGQLSASDTRFTAQASSGQAISLAAGTTSTLQRVHLVGNSSGISAGGALTLVDSDLTVSKYGLMVRDRATVSGTTVEGDAVGIYSTGTLQLRNTTVRSMGTYGQALLLTGTADLGTSADPGGNTFEATQVLLSHADPELPAPANALEVPAVGNTWKPNVQGADASGHYSTPTDITGAVMGDNVTLVKAEDVVHL